MEILQERIMKTRHDQFEVVSGYSNTALFLNEVQESADQHRNSLGFFAKSVFEEFARRDHLYVLIEKSPEGPRYAGHLLFQRRFPRGRIVQMFTLQKYRRLGLATKLLNHLKNSLTQNGFISIYARVAEDLIDANAFWAKQQFYVQRVEKGGAARNRQILVRCHELVSHQLFPTSGINADNPLGLTISSSNVTPLFLLDLNVLFDLSPRRLRRDEAAGLFQAERMNFCRLAISNEIREELQRTATQGKTDPMEAFISIFPSYPLLQGKESEQIINELASLIFPDKKEKTQFNANDHSDLRHVATVIQHDLAGLITNDGAILSAASQIKAKYGAEVLSPAAFKLDDTTSRFNNEFETLENSTLKLLEVSVKDEPAVHALLSKLNLSGSIIAGWLPTGMQSSIAKRYAVWNDGILVGYVTWSAKSSAGLMNVRIAIDEANSQAVNAARVILIYMLEQQTSQGAHQVRIELPSHQSYVRELATEFGFRGTQDQHCLTKLVLGNVLTSETWNARQNELATKSGLKLPATIPAYRNVDQQIQVLTPDGNKTHVTLDVLESLLSPALLCLPGRPAVITPVQRNFSEPLLGHSRQGSLLPHSTVSLFQNRHYLSSHRTLRHFKRGTLILFYESTKQKGRGEIVAIARVRQAYLKPNDSLETSDLEQSVLNMNNITSIGKSNMKTVTVFDNIFPLPNPVPLKTLKRIGCGRPNDLITTHPVTNVQLLDILREAFNCE